MITPPGGHNLSYPHTYSSGAPIITHTAATPQGSPHATLDSGRAAELNNRLTPAMALHASHSQGDDKQVSIHIFFDINITDDILIIFFFDFQSKV